MAKNRKYHTKEEWLEAKRLAARKYAKKLKENPEFITKNKKRLALLKKEREEDKQKMFLLKQVELTANEEWEAFKKRREEIRKEIDFEYYKL